jgi:osmotically inducible protein OsmC
MTTPQHIVRSASIHWEGDVAHGRGSIATESGKVAADYSFGTRFSGEPGTNPEELLGASHAACFTMALSAVLTRAGKPPTSLDTHARVAIQQVDGGFEIPSIELDVTGVVPGIGAGEFQQFATTAKETCPLSKALKAVPIALKATLKAA